VHTLDAPTAARPWAAVPPRVAVLLRTAVLPLVAVGVLAVGCAEPSAAIPHGAEPPPSADPIAPAADPAVPPSPAPGGTFEGRTIAPTMSHLGADWLTRPERITEEDPDALHAALAVRPGQTACDVGAGNGYHTVRLARSVGPRGRVVASDLQPEMLELLRERVAAEGLANVVPVAATDGDPGLPAGGCDLILLVDVYHELAAPEAALAAMRAALAPGGRIALVEFRGEDPEVPIKPEHKMTVAQVRRELEPRGFRLAQQFDGLPWQHLLVFERTP
jgi:protein-L-isoaspartate O-methyltransferase